MALGYGGFCQVARYFCSLTPLHDFTGCPELRMQCNMSPVAWYRVAASLWEHYDVVYDVTPASANHCVVSAIEYLGPRQVPKNISLITLTFKTKSFLESNASFMIQHI